MNNRRSGRCVTVALLAGAMLASHAASAEANVADDHGWVSRHFGRGHSHTFASDTHASPCGVRPNPWLQANPSRFLLKLRLRRSPFNSTPPPDDCTATDSGAGGSADGDGDGTWDPFNPAHGPDFGSNQGGGTGTWPTTGSGDPPSDDDGGPEFPGGDIAGPSDHDTDPQFFPYFAAGPSDDLDEGRPVTGREGPLAVPEPAMLALLGLGLAGLAASRRRKRN